MRTIYNQIKKELKDKKGAVNFEDYMDMTPDIFPYEAVDAMWNDHDKIDAAFSVEVSKMSREELVQRLYAAMRMFDELTRYAEDARDDARSAQELYKSYQEDVEKICRVAADMYEEQKSRESNPNFKTF